MIYGRAGGFQNTRPFDNRPDSREKYVVRPAENAALTSPRIGEVMLLAVTRRWPDLELIDPEPNWWSSGPFRGVDALTVTD